MASISPASTAKSLRAFRFWKSERKAQVEAKSNVETIEPVEPVTANAHADEEEHYDDAVLEMALFAQLIMQPRHRVSLVPLPPETRAAARYASTEKGAHTETLGFVKAV